MQRPSMHFPPARLMVLVGVIAVGLAAMRDASDLVEKIAFNVTLLALIVGLLGALVRRGDGAWTGFALFGWIYAILSLAPNLSVLFDPKLLTSSLIDGLAVRLHPDPDTSPAPPKFNSQFEARLGTGRILEESLTLVPDAPELLALLTSAERSGLERYLAQVRASKARAATRAQRLVNAWLIGRALFVLVFAMIGAGIGRLLAERRPSTRPARAMRP